MTPKESALSSVGAKIRAIFGTWFSRQGSKNTWFAKQAEGLQNGEQNGDIPPDSDTPPTKRD